MQGDALVGRDKQDGAAPQCDVGERSGGGRCGVAFDDQDYAGAVDWSDGVLLHQGRDLCPHDGEVWHWGVVQEHAGVRAVLDRWKDFGAGGGWSVVQHLAQRVDVDVFRCQTGPHRVV